MNVCGFTQDRPSAGAAQVVTLAGRARPSSGAACNQGRRPSLMPRPRPLSPSPDSLSA